MLFDAATQQSSDQECRMTMPLFCLNRIHRYQLFGKLTRSKCRSEQGVANEPHYIEFDTE
jgi:hypothetical protein